ncbi:MAG TPA: hypothetical protein VFP03_02420 [Jiangellaceae bacterium]|nr:hypothetical protein [Jiangellaceae bacterium]
MTSQTGSRWHERLDATGAVYGSLLAASVVVGQAPLQESVPPVELAVILLATGAVFWLVHVYSRTLGHYVIDGRFHRHRLAHAMREESPIILAAIPPAVAALVVGAISNASSAAWWAFFVAIAGQVVWAIVAAREAGQPRIGVFLAAAVNLGLGLVLVALKVAISH